MDTPSTSNRLLRPAPAPLQHSRRPAFGLAYMKTTSSVTTASALTLQSSWASIRCRMYRQRLLFHGRRVGRGSDEGARLPCSLSCASTLFGPPLALCWSTSFCVKTLLRLSTPAGFPETLEPAHFFVCQPTGWTGPSSGAACARASGW